MKKLFFTAVAVVFYFFGFSQKDTMVARLEKRLEQINDIETKLMVFDTLAMRAITFAPADLPAYADKALFWAEESRDRSLMVKARITIADAYTNGNSMADSKIKAETYSKEAYEISKQDGVASIQKVGAAMLMARVARSFGNATKGLTYNQEALTLANDSGNDSLMVTANVGLGNTLLYLDESIKAFRCYVLGQQIASSTKHPSKKELIKDIDNCFVRFYGKLEKYDKALDYQYKLLAQSREEKDYTSVLSIYSAIANMEIAAKNAGAAEQVYNVMEKLVDSTKQENFRISVVTGKLNVLIEKRDKENALKYYREHPEIKTIFEMTGQMHILNFGLGNLFQHFKMYDSSKYYFNLAMPVFNQVGTVFSKIQINDEYGKLLFKTEKYQQAIPHFLLVEKLSDSVKNISTKISALQYLDTCYQRIGDYKMAYTYSDKYINAKKELDEKQKAQDLLGLEIDAENKRKERLETEEKEATIKRHNWQYMGIIMAIVALFTLLASFGVFKVSIKWIKALGFISFILLFEFIILIADNWIHHATHGEPWKVLAIKVVLIAALLPLHHFLEKRVIQYITRHRHEGKDTDEILAMQKTKPLKYSSKNIS
jgi:tetratricopeptide (TPR) repeat protein